MAEKGFTWKQKVDSADVKQLNTEKPAEIEAIASHISEFIQQNSSVNNGLIRNTVYNELYGMEVDGQMRFMQSIAPQEVKVRGRKGKSDEVYSLCSFSFDDVDEAFEARGVKINERGWSKITAYDRRVYNAVGTLWVNGRTSFSCTEIYSIMTGYSRNNPNKSQLDAIVKSIHKLERIRVFIDLTEEVNAGIIKDKEPLIRAGVLKSHSDKIKRAVINGRMLTYNGLEIESEEGAKKDTIALTSIPLLLAYNLAKRTVINIPMSMLGKVMQDQSASEKTIAFQDYLLMRICSYKNGKLLENKIVFETIYRDSGIEKPSTNDYTEKGDKKKSASQVAVEIKRDRDLIVNMFKIWEKEGFIKGYHLVKKGKSYESIVFEVEETEAIDDKQS